MTIFEYWKKAFSLNWDTAADWNSGKIPDGTIGASLLTFAARYTVTSSSANAAYGLGIYAGATLDITEGTFTNQNYLESDGVVKIENDAEYVAGFLGADAQGYGNSGKFELDGGTFDVLDSFLSLNNGGKVLLSNSASNMVTGGTSTEAAKLVNSRQTIAGAGSIAGPFLLFSNGRHGVVDASDKIGLKIDIGSEIDNAGLIESTNSGGLLIEGNIDNEGVVKASKGLVQVTGDVDGNGLLEIAGAGQIELGGYASQDVQFAKRATGTLILDHGSTNFVDEIYGARAGVHIDLRDVVDNATTHPSFTIVGAHDGYSFTVTDGTHSVALVLMAGLDAYGAKSFTLGTDGHGGTLVSVV